MTRNGQFSLWHLFVELSLIGTTIGAIRLIVVLWERPWLHGLVVTPLFFALPVLFGAVIGGLSGRIRAGAGWGGLASFVLFLILLFFGPRPQ